MRRRIRDDEAVQRNGRVGQPRLDVLDRLKKLDLGVGEADVPDALRIDEGNVLAVSGEQPEDEVGMEVTSLEEAYAAAPA